MDIGGFKVGEQIYKLAAFADDILFFTMPNLFKFLKEYGDVSNFKINPGKSVVNSKDEYSLQQEFPFPWRKTEVKYLGITLTTSLGKLYQANYIALLEELKIEIKRIVVRPLSWIGRINALKMIILPKIMYKFQMLPIYMPPAYFGVIKTLITKLIWQNKKPRIALETLQKEKS